MACSTDGLRFERIEGIWRFLLPERMAHFARFSHEYQTVRQAEGRGANDPAYYRSLPFADLSGRFVADWHIRAISFRVFVQRVLQPLEKQLARPLCVVDLGAGNGWLSNRLAERGHRPVAVDLQINALDGLGTHQFYEHSFCPVQAEFDRLPWANSQFDLVVYNASLHYSENYETTLQEALRLLQPSGLVIILDSPIYRERHSGRQMVIERQSQFVRQFGFASDALASEHFLTEDRLTDLARAVGVRWQTYEPHYGWRWWLRPLIARWRGRREPAQFRVIVGRRL